MALDFLSSEYFRSGPSTAGGDMQKVVSEISGAVFSLPWLIAKDHGLFAAEGIDMEFVRTRPSGAVPQTENPEDVNPVLGHTAFEERRVSIYRA
jgi:NitT/TauT family transport system substrate-binding protein